MKLVALIEAADHVCYRYRIEAFAWALAERGLELEPDPFRRGVLPRIHQLRALRRADVTILQRKLLPIWQLRILRRAARYLIYDVDDALFCRDSYHRKPPESWQRLARFWATVYAADAIIVGNAHLEERVASYVERERVHLIPTCVEPRAYPLARHERLGSGIRLAWIGQKSTLPSLHRAQPQLAAAAGEGPPGLELRVISDRFPTLSRVPVVPRPWSSATEAAELADCDIGISWLPDDPWSRGKCGLKVLQYMAAGLPVVANPVGMNGRMVVDGRTGLLASTPAEWAAAIRRLAANPGLRRHMGDAGRRLVEEQFSVGSWGPRFAAAIAQAARGEVSRLVAGEAPAQIGPANVTNLARQGSLTFEK
ncbi:MAG: glycosyltransferase family 4 protein [Planctomycetota bacterium]